MFSSQLVIISLMMMLLIKTCWSITEGIPFVPVSACIVIVIFGNIQCVCKFYVFCRHQVELVADVK